MTQPTSEALSDEELAEVRAIPICGDKAHRHGGGCHVWASANRITIARLLATLDHALARCEAAEKRVEELEGDAVTVATWILRGNIRRRWEGELSGWIV